MAKRVCSVPGCPIVSDKTRCAGHRRQREQDRGSAARRGYGHAHKALREQWAPLVATGNVKCWQCGEYLAADKPWDLGHDKHDRSKYRGPECWSCNRSTNK